MDLLYYGLGYEGKCNNIKFYVVSETYPYIFLQTMPTNNLYSVELLIIIQKLQLCVWGGGGGWVGVQEVTRSHLTVTQNVFFSLHGYSLSLHQ